MDPPKTSNTEIVAKVKSAEPNALAPKAGNLVTLATWNSEDQSQQQAVKSCFGIGTGELAPEIEAIVQQMRVGDSWTVKKFNELNQKQEIINITLLQVKEQEGETKPISANARAEENKKEGNTLIKEKKYKEAIESYKKAYQLLEYCCDREAVETRLSVVSNLALGTLSANRFHQCLEWCDKYNCESTEPNKKILYRQVSAYKGLKQWQSAKENIGKALLQFKNDQEATNDFNALREAIEKEQKEEIVKQKKMYSNMFG